MAFGMDDFELGVCEPFLLCEPPAGLPCGRVPHFQDADNKAQLHVEWLQVFCFPHPELLEKNGTLPVGLFRHGKVQHFVAMSPECREH